MKLQLTVYVDETDERSEEILDELTTVAAENEGATLHTAAGVPIPIDIAEVKHLRAGSRGE